MLKRAKKSINNKMRKYIQEASLRAQKNSKEQLLFSTPVYVLHPLPDHVDLQAVLRKLEALLPRHFCAGVEAIYVGHLKEFDEREVNAMYKDSAIYVTNRQESAKDMIDDIVHELAHAVESIAMAEIYDDDKIEQEFLVKRDALYRILREEGFVPSVEQFRDPEYSEELDSYFHVYVGYPKLTMLSMGLFVSPYGATSLREYFANAFEEYFLGDRSYVKKISTQVYNKLEKIKEKGEYYNV